MIKLTKNQLAKKKQMIADYIKSANAADGSKLDSNANVTSKNVATLENEINKDINIQVNRGLVSDKIREIYGTNFFSRTLSRFNILKQFQKEGDILYKEYNRQIEDHEIYVHDETSLKPYCVAITMYPFLTDGLKSLDGDSEAPKHIESFCGSFLNLMFLVSSQFAGAVATAEFLLYFDYFARKDFGDDYLATHKRKITNLLQQVVYTINQPAAARGGQSIFWNLSIFDRYYYESMFGHFSFPDFSQPKWETLEPLQEFFLDWLNTEREKALLTFPVVTIAMLKDGDSPKDKDFTNMCATQLEKGNSFFVYMSDDVDSLASCCRLRNEVTDNTFSHTLGAGGVATGSINVITLNINRLVQDGRDLREEIQKIHKYQVAYKQVIETYLNAGMLPVYDAGFIQLKKQFLTIGINGFVEAAEFKDIEVGNNPEYIEFAQDMLKVIFDENQNGKKHYGCMFNTEFVPAENLGVKNAKWDRKDGYVVKRDVYNSYFYPVESESVNIVDKFVLHGHEINQYLDGGSALHVNLDQLMCKDAFLRLFDLAAKTGCNYFCTNIKSTICNTCDNIDKNTLSVCPECGSVDLDYATRIIGYLKRVSSFSTDRQIEEGIREYHKEVK